MSDWTETLLLDSSFIILKAVFQWCIFLTYVYVRVLKHASSSLRVLSTPYVYGRKKNTSMENSLKIQSVPCTVHKTGIKVNKKIDFSWVSRPYLDWLYGLSLQLRFYDYLKHLFYKRTTEFCLSFALSQFWVCNSKASRFRQLNC